MSATYDTPAQYQRDLRSARKEWKRTKDSTAKWSFGVRPVSGVLTNLVGEVLTGSESQRNKMRPVCKFSQVSRSPPKKEHNVVKTLRAKGGNCEMPAGRVRNKINAQQEIREQGSGSLNRSVSDIAVSADTCGVQLHRVLYPFDRADTPGRTVALDVFVKTNGRETERLVEKEYEVLDVNGEALRGRKARKSLRRPNLGGACGVEKYEAEEDEGFELV